MKKNFFQKPQYKVGNSLEHQLQGFQDKFSELATSVEMKHLDGEGVERTIVEYPFEASGIAEMILSIMEVDRLTVVYMEVNERKLSDIILQCTIEKEPIKGTVKIICPLSGNVIETFTFTPAL